MIPDRFITGQLSRFNTVGSSCGQFITDQFIAGRFITKHEKQLAVGAVLIGIVRCNHMTLVSLTCTFVQ